MGTIHGSAKVDFKPQANLKYDFESGSGEGWVTGTSGDTEHVVWYSEINTLSKHSGTYGFMFGADASNQNSAAGFLIGGQTPLVGMFPASFKEISLWIKIECGDTVQPLTRVNVYMCEVDGTNLITLVGGAGSAFTGQTDYWDQLYSHEWTNIVFRPSSINPTEWNDYITSRVDPLAPLVIQVYYEIYAGLSGEESSRVYLDDIDIDTGDTSIILSNQMQKTHSTYPISGTITRDIDVSTSGYDVIWDDNKSFVSGELTDRIVEMKSGLDINKTAVIIDNDPKTVTVKTIWSMLSSIITNSNWDSRIEPAIVTLSDGCVIMMGGGFPTEYANDVWLLNSGDIAWTCMTSSAEWSGRFGHTAVAMFDDSIVLVGGYHDVQLGDVWRSTDKGATWTCMTSSAEFGSVYDHASVWIGDGGVGSVIIIGGYGSTDKQVWSSPDYGSTWTLVADNQPFGTRFLAGCVTTQNQAVITLVGGSDGTNSLNDVWKSESGGASGTWQCVTTGIDPGWVGRYSFGCVSLLDGSIWIMGGYGVSGFLNDVWRSPDEGATWAQVTSSTLWEARAGLSNSAVLRLDNYSNDNDSIIIVGGYSGTYPYHTDVWECYIDHNTNSVSGDIYSIGDIFGMRSAIPVSYFDLSNVKLTRKV